MWLQYSCLLLGQLKFHFDAKLTKYGKWKLEQGVEIEKCKSNLFSFSLKSIPVLSGSAVNLWMSHKSRILPIVEKLLPPCSHIWGDKLWLLQVPATFYLMNGSKGLLDKHQLLISVSSCRHEEKLNRKTLCSCYSPTKFCIFKIWAWCKNKNGCASAVMSKDSFYGLWLKTPGNSRKC